MVYITSLLMHSFRQILIGYIVCASSFGCAVAKTTSSVCTYHYTEKSILINSHSTTVEYYIPNGPGPFPLVFMLHGSAGAFTIKSHEEPPEDNFGEKTLARNCFAVVLPHYLEAVGLQSMTDKSEMISRFPELLAITESLLDRAEALPWVKDRSVLLFGESLGGYLSVALALRRAEVTSVSERSGGLPAGYASANPHFISILISHGINDTLVSVKEAEALNQYCLNHNLSVTMHLYPGVGHFVSRAVQSQIISETMNYFLKRIGDS